MGWTFGFSTIKRGLSFVSAGYFDKMASRVTGKQVSFGKCIAAKVNQCEPWNDHFYDSSLVGIRDALKDKDFNSARALAAFGAKEDARGDCVVLLEKVIEFMAAGEEVEVEMFPYFTD